MSLFSTVEQAPPDPILGVTEKYLADKRPAKVNLGVGVYQDASGRLPLMRCVEIAEQRLAEDPKPRGYLPIDGLASYTADVRELVFGADSPLISQGRVVTVQALGGTGASQARRRLPAPGRRRGHCVDQRPVVGESPGVVHPGRVLGVVVPLLRPGPPGHRFRRHAGRPDRRRSRARSWCCTPAATTRPATTSTAEQWAQVLGRRRGAESGAVPRHGLPGLQRRA